MAFDRLSDGSLDYQPCRYGKSKLLFRGPKKRLEAGYVAFLGGTETYGKFVVRPYPEILGGMLGVTSLNLGAVNAGVDTFHDDTTVLGLAREADLRVIQLSGAQNMSNRFYMVHPRRNDRFLRASPALKALYPDVDFSQIDFTGHLLATLRERSEEKFAAIVEEMRTAWMSRITRLIEMVGGPTLLVWVSTRRPEDAARADRCEPRLVDRAMVDAVRGGVEGLVEVIMPRQVPGTVPEGMVVSGMQIAAAAGLPGPETHMEIARKLQGVIARKGLL